MRSRSVHEEIPEALAGQRIDRVVALVADISRREAAAALAEQRVTLDGAAPEKASERVRAGQSIRVEVVETDDAPAPDPAVVVPVIHEDPHLLVVDKPAGMVVHPGAGVRAGTMVHGLLAAYPDLVGVGPVERPGIVHRLDKGTSGLLIVARTNEALANLSAQLGARTVLRRYLALASGSFDAAEGLIDAPIGRSPNDAMRQAVVADGRPARTRYEVLERFQDPAQTLVACRLETGRTHQIRVHLEAIGHGVVGDDRYGTLTGAEGLRRPFLHAASLGFDHPDDARRMHFESDLPADLAAVLRRRRSDQDD